MISEKKKNRQKREVHEVHKYFDFMEETKKILSPFVFFVFFVVLIFSCTKDKTSPADKTAIKPADWTISRGSPQLTGYADAELNGEIKIKWTMDLDDVMISAPVISDGILYAASQNGSVYAVLLENRTVKWKKTFEDSFESSPVFLDNSLYLGSLGGLFFRLDSLDGSVVWQAEIGTRIAGSANILPADRQFIFFGCYDSGFYSVDTDSGKIRGSLQAESYINGTPAADENILAFGSCDGNLYIADGLKDEKETVFEFGNYIAGSPLIQNGTVTAAAYNGMIKSYDLETKKLLWEWQEPSNGAFVASPSSDGRLIVTGNKNGTVYALDAWSGQLAWEFKCGGGIEASALIAGDKVFIGSADGYLYIIDLNNGKEITSFAMDGIPYSASAWYNGNVYTITDKGVIYCMGL